VDLIKAYGFIHCGLHDDLNDLAPEESLVLDTPAGAWTITPSRTRTRHEEIVNPWAYDEARVS
jgi:hypothetical protein